MDSTVSGGREEERSRRMRVTRCPGRGVLGRTRDCVGSTVSARERCMATSTSARSVVSDCTLRNEAMTSMDTQPDCRRERRKESLDRFSREKYHSSCPVRAVSSPSPVRGMEGLLEDEVGEGEPSASAEERYGDGEGGGCTGEREEDMTQRWRKRRREGRGGDESRGRGGEVLGTATNESRMRESRGCSSRVVHQQRRTRMEGYDCRAALACCGHAQQGMRLVGQKVTRVGERGGEEDDRSTLHRTASSQRGG